MKAAEKRTEQAEDAKMETESKIADVAERQYDDKLKADEKVFQAKMVKALTATNKTKPQKEPSLYFQALSWLKV